jgi:DNA invertase Pin-like site-specific DNA recombinase
MLAPRIAIYARYSSNLQNPSSVSDQISLCKRLITQQFQAEPIAIFSDEAMTGENMHRPGVTALMAAIADQEIDLVVAEGLDRISRGLADIARFHQTAKYYKVRIYTAHEGEVGDLHIGFKGTMNALFLNDLRDKVRRGHRAAAEAGRGISCVAYGYRAVKGVTDERGRYINGLREIDETEAAVVLRIYEAVADGIPVGRICKELNDEGIPSPSGVTWRVHSISGEGTRGKGILHNELYHGWLIYNRTRKVVDPATGRRRYLQNPKSEWGITRVDHMQIVSDELWERVQARLHHRQAAALKERKFSAGRRPQLQDGLGHARPLTGLVKCGWCGGQKSVANKKRYICDTYRFYQRRCKNARGRQEMEIIQAVFDELRKQVITVGDWDQRIAKRLEAEDSRRQKIKAEKEKLEQRLHRLLNAIEAGVKLPETTKRVIDLQDRLNLLRRQPQMPDLGLSSDEIRNRLSAALDAMEQEFLNQKFALPIHRLLEMVVKKIVLTPLPDSKVGETIDVQLRPEGWPDFYLRVHAEWPKVGSSCL